MDSGEPRERIRAAVASLKSQGWTVTDEQHAAVPYPYPRLERDGLRLSLDPDARRGSDAMSFAVSGDYIRTAEGQDAEFSGTQKISLDQGGLSNLRPGRVLTGVDADGGRGPG